MPDATQYLCKPLHINFTWNLKDNIVELLEGVRYCPLNNILTFQKYSCSNGLTQSHCGGICGFVLSRIVAILEFFFFGGGGFKSLVCYSQSFCELAPSPMTNYSGTSGCWELQYVLTQHNMSVLLVKVLLAMLFLSYQLTLPIYVLKSLNRDSVPYIIN